MNTILRPLICYRVRSSSVIFSIALTGKNHYNIDMEKRRSKRHRLSLKAERISVNKNYGVFIENISETGIHILTTHSQANKVYLPGREIDLNFRLSSGKSLNLHCRVRWAHPKTPPDDLADSIGLEVIDPPVQYIEFVHSLH